MIFTFSALYVILMSMNILISFTLKVHWMGFFYFILHHLLMKRLLGNNVRLFDDLK